MKVMLWIGFVLASMVQQAWAVTVDEVVEMSARGDNAKQIIRRIHADKTVFTLDAATIERLTEAGVHDRVVKWMVNSSVAYSPPVETPKVIEKRRRAYEAGRARAEEKLSDLSSRSATGALLIVGGTAVGTVGMIVVYDMIFFPSFDGDSEGRGNAAAVAMVVGSLMATTGYAVMPSEADFVRARREVPSAGAQTLTGRFDPGFASPTSLLSGRF